MGGPLEGTRVIACTHWFQGSTAGRILGDLGADVIKIEERIHGDQMRGFIQQGYGVGTHRVERNYNFEHCNRSTRSMTLDLRKEEGKEIIYRLVEKSDVFLHNWRGGDTPKRLGVDYETLSRLNPGLVYCHASSWGPEGPISDRPGFEPAAQSRGGWLDIYTEPGRPPPLLPGGPGDIIGATVAVVGIIAALQAKQRTGEGQKVDVSLLGSLLQTEATQLSALLIANTEYPKRSRVTMGNVLYNHYRCADGRWISLTMMQPDRYWSNFCKAVGLENLEKDPRFENLEVRAQNAVECIQILDEVFATKTRDEWIKHFEETEVDLVYAPVQSIHEVITDPQVLANEYIVEFDHPSFGRIKVVGLPYKFSKTPASISRAAPEFGQHTEEVLLDMGYTWDDIVQLKEKQMI